MSDSNQDNRNDKRDRWKMIASLLGATVPEEPVSEEPAPEVPIVEEPVLRQPVREEPDQADSLGVESNWPSPTAAIAESTIAESTSCAVPLVEQPRAKRARPTTVASNWNALCGELGVEVPQEVASDEVVSPSSTAWSEPTKLVPSDLPAPDWSTPLSDATAERVPSLSFFDPDAVLEVDTVEAEFEAEFEAEQDSDATANPVADQIDEADREVADDRSAVRSGESPAVRRRRRRGRRRGGSAERDETTAENVSEVSAEAEDQDGTAETPLSTAPSTVDGEGKGEGSEDEPVTERGRRSRRRRRRSPRREEVRADSEEPIDGTDVDVDEVEEKPQDLDDDAELDDAELDDVGLDDDDDDDDDDDSSIRRGRGSSRTASGDESRQDGDGAGRGKHKKIPTWEEAMSVIVSANIESRHRDSDGGKGRPRGPRRRGRSSHDRP
ncbi:MAG: hypothetical protein ACYC3X_04665 [Pirellulaceae bacterium]